MSFRVRILPLATKQIASWNLSDFILVDVYVHLNNDLPVNPKSKLYPASDEGLLYPFSVVDPENRLHEHTFWFRVYYHTDEETLLVVSGVYRRQTGYA